MPRFETYVMYASRLPLALLHTLPTKTRNCAHNIDTTKPFCPDCGERVWEETFNDEFILPHRQQGVLTYLSEPYEAYIYVGFILGSIDTNYYTHVGRPINTVTTDMQLELKQFLKKHGREDATPSTLLIIYRDPDY